jgi:type II secretory pathway pseudopilin PulG
MTSGFTMVELTLAMAFVAVLMLVIASTVIQIGNIYNKGVTMKAVEQAGRLITADIRQTISQGSAVSLNEDCVYHTINTAGTIGTVNCENAPPSNTRGGRLCTGTYTYVWNYGRAINSTTEPLPNRYSDPVEQEKIRLIKIRDTDSYFCAQPTIPIPKGNATELLSRAAMTGTEMDLALHQYTIEKIAQSSNQGFYRFVITIGTNDTNYIQTGGDCKTPSDDFQAQNFCAVNIFEFTALNDIIGGQR